MMNGLKHLLVMIVLCGGFATFGSCDRLIEIPEPANLITAESIFEDYALLDDALANCYRTLDFHEQFLPYLGLYVDELTTNSQLALYQDFLTNTLTPETNLGNLSVWRTLYSVIYQANFIIEGLEKRGEAVVGAPAYRNVLGEAKFVRAYSYFYLMNLWGDVPLVLTVGVSQTSVAERHPTSAIYNQIIVDLEEAEALLPTIGEQTKSRASATAASALLARVFLYQEDWSSAKMKSANVIGEMPPLRENLENVFREGHAETILELWKERRYSYGAIYIPASPSAVPTFMMSDKLLGLFDERDRRNSLYISVNDHGQYFPYKYQVRVASAEVEFDILLRLPEMYLINAEAKLKSGDIQGSIEMLNLVRARAGLSALDRALSEDLIAKKLADERVREFFCEGGHRFFDLKRRGELDTVMAQAKPTWASHFRFFPVPQQDIDRNPRLTQNEGYY